MADDDRNESNSSLSKPLFAAASLFPSASAVRHEYVGTSFSKESDESEEEEDLASLKLELAPSTLHAIIAAQKIQIPDTETPKEENDVVDKPAKEAHTEFDCKRKLPWLSETLNTSENERSPKRKRSKDKHKKKKKHKEKKKKHHTPTSGNAIPFLPKIPKGAVFLDDIKDLKPEQAFCTDRRPNIDLWHYESVSKLHIAKYKPLRHMCLGTSHIYYTDRKNKTKAKENRMRYFGKEGIKQLHVKGVECLSSEYKSTKFSFPHDFIGFPKDDQRSQEVTIGNYSCLDEATELYVKGRDAGYSKHPEILSDNYVMNDIYEKVKVFNQKTREDPENVNLWLEFVHFQDVLAQEDKSFQGHAISLREVYQPSKSVIEKKLAILDKALAVNPSSIELKLAQLQLYQDIWESAKLEKAWEDLLFIHSANVDLWRQYLSIQQSRLHKFSFGRIVKCYHKCFKTLISIFDGHVKALNRKDDMEEKMIGLFSQYCDFLQNTGYTERGVSSYQAIIELNLFCPTSLNLSTCKERAEKFESFWESGVPRFGETGAKGWLKWDGKKSDGSIAISDSGSTEEQEQEDAIVQEKLPRSQTWLKMEKIHQDAHWLPWRPDTAKGETEEDCEDLDRLVLFDDISPAIFKFTKSDSCVKIICLFLKFLGLSSEVLDTKLEHLNEYLNNSQYEQYSKISINQLPLLANFKCGLEVESAWAPHRCLIILISEVLLQAERYFSVSHRSLFTLLRLELEIKKHGGFRALKISKSATKDLKKFGKNFLKESQNRNNLVLWDSYIRLLWACSDKMAETVSMIDTALAMFMGTTSMLDPDKGFGLCLLCQTFCQIMINFDPLEYIQACSRNSPPGTEDKNQVIACLGALIEKKDFKSSSRAEVTPAYILKIRKRFQSTLEDLYGKLTLCLEHSFCNLLVAVVNCFSLFELCASSFKNASAIYTIAREHLKSVSCNDRTKSSIIVKLQKQLFISQIAFISNVMHITFISLGNIRQVIAEALQEFPECPQFHAAFLDIESGSYIAGRLRKYYDRCLKSSTSVVCPLFAVVGEMMRLQVVVKTLDVTDYLHTGISDSGIVHHIRSVFEHSLQKHTSSHCPLLWRLYLMFEANHGSKSRAKGIFYRALQNCPWAKCLYMDGVAIFGDSELQEVMDLMTEEEIRVRMPLEEVDLLITAERDKLQEEQNPIEKQDAKMYVSGENGDSNFLLQ